jgi:membrane-bound serine protease (ClpP class)
LAPSYSLLAEHGPDEYSALMALVAILIGAGLILLFLETILPGLIAGALGFLSLVSAVVYAYFELGLKAGNATVLIVGGLLLIGTVLWVKFFPDSRMAQVFVSRRQIGTVGAEKPELLGENGIALTTLRPAGTAVFAGKRVDVVTEGGFVEKGKEVSVIAVEGLRVVVRPRET